MQEPNSYSYFNQQQEAKRKRLRNLQEKLANKKLRDDELVRQDSGLFTGPKRVIIDNNNSEL